MLEPMRSNNHHDEADQTDEDDDEARYMPVDSQTSFHGQLSRFLHTTRRTAVMAQASNLLAINDAPPTTRGKSRSQSSSTPPTPSPSPSKAARKKRRSPATPDTVSPPSLLRDTIPPNLILLLIGVNPGLLTGSTGFAYAHPSNLFWKLLHSSGITTRRHAPSDTYKLPALYAVGNTNIVERPTRDASMLRKSEMDAGVAVLEEKIAARRPEAVCLVGKGIWEAVWRVRRGQAIKKDEFRYGWQDRDQNMGRVPGEDWDGARVFVATTTSGLAAGMSLAEKQAVWAELGQWVVQRREERRATAADDLGGGSGDDRSMEKQAEPIP